MLISLVEALLLCTALYLGLGALVAVLFVSIGVGMRDIAARGASLWFRVFIFWGVLALWPIVVLRWLVFPTINHPHEDNEETSA